MENNVYYANLFDIYGELLPEKEQIYFKDYYFENLLIDEISENHKVTKNAVSKQLKSARNSLDLYENTIHMYKYKTELKNEFKNEKEILKRIDKYDTII